jgi:hypothetical protein
VTSPAFSTYDPTTQIGPIGVNFVRSRFALATDKGLLSWSTPPSNLSFQASVPGVPESATWAMMIFGFGAIGSSMRRRSRITAAAI